MKFEGTADYVATPDLTVAVNAAITLERPLLVKGEPGTGKTELARADRRRPRAAADRVARQVDHQGARRASTNTTRSAACATASSATRACTTFATTSAPARSGGPSPRTQRLVLLIDEIDKADIEFPNDLLQELDRMEFFVYETGETVRARHRPIVIITSNNEKELPDAFLRRCFFHYIRFPDEETLARIVEVHFPGDQVAPGARRPDPLLRDPRDPGPEEEAVDLRGARLAEAAARRGPGAGGPAAGSGATCCRGCTARS